MNVIGYDPGFGNTKVCAGRNGAVGMVQSAVSVPAQIGKAAIGMKSAGRRAKLVSFDGRTYAVGEGAAARGTLRTSLDYGAITSPERRALLYTALSIQPGAATGSNLLVVGLPVNLLTDDQQTGDVMASLKTLKGRHAFSVLNDGTHGFEIERIKILAQPAGAYLDWAYDDKLNERDNADTAEVLVIDIGMNTLDIYALKGGEVVDAFIGGAEVGVHRLLDMMHTNVGHDIMELDAMLRKGTLKYNGGNLDDYCNEVVAAIKRTIPNLRRFDVVIPCGGGAVVLGNRLTRALVARGAALFEPDDPLTTNVRGFWKYGMLSL